MRMFAGPNGSGKTSLRIVVPHPLWGTYLNPDEIEEQIRAQGFLDLTAYNVTSTPKEALSFFTNSSFLQSVGLSINASRLDFAAGRLLFGTVPINAYFA